MGKLLRYFFLMKRSTLPKHSRRASYMPVCYEAINLFTEPQNFMLMFLICRFKGLYLIVFLFDGLLMLSLDLFNFCIKSTWYDVFLDVLLKSLTLIFWRFYNEIKSACKKDKNIMILSVFPRGVHTTDAPFSLEEDPGVLIFFQ